MLQPKSGAVPRALRLVAVLFKTLFFALLILFISSLPLVIRQSEGRLVLRPVYLLMALDFLEGLPDGRSLSFAAGDFHWPGIFLAREGYVSLGGFYPALAHLGPDGSWSAGRPTAGHGDPPAIMLANYLVRVSAPTGLRFAATGRLVREKQERDRNVFLAVSGPVREFFLCGAGDCRRLRIRRQGVTISSYYPPGSRQPGINAAYYAADALRIFERRSGPYPYDELDVVSAPMSTHGLGMEYPGIIVITNELYDPDGRLGIYDADFLQEGIAAHEVAHQWFYNLVGSDPVAEPWLDEAFTQYATWLYFSTIRGEWGGLPLLHVHGKPLVPHKPGAHPHRPARIGLQQPGVWGHHLRTGAHLPVHLEPYRRPGVLRGADGPLHRPLPLAGSRFRGLRPAAL